MEVENDLAEAVQAEIAAEESAAPPTPAAAPAPPASPAPDWREQALHEARLRERNIRQENDKLRAEFEEFKKSLAPKPPPRPDKSDPIALLDWLDKYADTESGKSAAREEAEAKAQAERNQQLEVIDHYYESIDEFRDSTPDFNEAHNFLERWHNEQTKAEGVRNPRVRLQRQMADEYKFVKDAIDRGLNPAAAIYAKARELGWQPAATDAQQPATASPAPAATASTPPRDPSTGQFAPAKPAPRSLSHAPGSAARDPMSAEAIAAMSDADFDRMLTKDPDAWRRAHGR